MDANLNNCNGMLKYRIMEVSGQLHALAAVTPRTHWIGGWVGPEPVYMSGIDPRQSNLSLY
jgi:hypothetical protein